MEFGVAEVLPNYSGGLGILAGDHLKSASDLGLPLIAVGLLLPVGLLPAVADRRRLAARDLSVAGSAGPAAAAAHRRDGRPGAGRAGDAGRRPAATRACGSRRWAEFRCCCWIPTFRRTSTTCAASPTGSTAATRNTGSSRRSWPASAACGRSARSPKWRACPRPEVFHMNEGHAGFLGVERIRELIDAGLDFDTALTVVRSSTVFTTHTPVPAGHRPVPRRDGRSGTSAARPTGRRARCPGCCPAAAGPDRRVRRRGRPVEVQHGAHGSAAGAARHRGVAAARSGQPRHVQRAVAGLRPGRGADRLDHQRRARADVGGAAVGGTGPRTDRQRRSRLAERSPTTWQRLQQVDPGHLWWIRSAAARAPRRGRARPAAPLVAGARRLRCRIGLDCNGIRPRRADHRVRPPGARPTSG